MNRGRGTRAGAWWLWTIATGAILVICTLVSGAIAGQGDDLFAQGNQAYVEGKYDEAISIYNRVLREVGYSAPLLFNMANAYYQKKEVGQAILNYERALYLDPGNGEIQSNLALARKDFGLASDPIPSWQQPFHMLSVNGWTWLLSGAFGAFSLMILLRGMGPSRFQGKAFKTVRAGAILFLLTGGVGLALQTRNLGRGVVTTDHANLRVSPFDSAASSMSIDDGKIVRMAKSYQDYIWVKGEDGQSGWIKKDAVEPVIIGETRS
jgi:tetratricopeptide (TPR) repeat protein